MAFKKRVGVLAGVSPCISYTTNIPQNDIGHCFGLCSGLQAPGHRGRVEVRQGHREPVRPALIRRAAVQAAFFGSRFSHDQCHSLVAFGFGSIACAL